MQNIQPGFGKQIEVTHEERQFILSICEELAKGKQSKAAKNGGTTPSFQATLDAAEQAQKVKR